MAPTTCSIASYTRKTHLTSPHLTSPHFLQKWFWSGFYFHHTNRRPQLKKENKEQKPIPATTVTNNASTPNYSRYNIRTWIPGWRNTVSRTNSVQNKQIVQCTIVHCTAVTHSNYNHYAIPPYSTAVHNKNTRPPYTNLSHTISYQHNIVPTYYRTTLLHSSTLYTTIKIHDHHTNLCTMLYTDTYYTQQCICMYVPAVQLKTTYYCPLLCVPYYVATVCPIHTVRSVQYVTYYLLYGPTIPSYRSTMFYKNYIHLRDVLYKSQNRI